MDVYIYICMDMLLNNIDRLRVRGALPVWRIRVAEFVASDFSLKC